VVISADKCMFAVTSVCDVKKCDAESQRAAMVSSVRFQRRLRDALGAPKRAQRPACGQQIIVSDGRGGTRANARCAGSGASRRGAMAGVGGRQALGGRAGESQAARVSSIYGANEGNQRDTGAEEPE
jgi:hypothetical protein